MKATTLILLALTAALLAAPAVPCRADLYADLAKYTYGDDSKAAEKLEQLVKETEPGNYAPIEAKLIEIVQSKDATQDGKAFACRAPADRHPQGGARSGRPAR